MERFSPGTAWRGNWSLLWDSMEQYNVKAREGMLITTMIMGRGAAQEPSSGVYTFQGGGDRNGGPGEALLLIWTFFLASAKHRGWNLNS